MLTPFYFSFLLPLLSHLFPILHHQQGLPSLMLRCILNSATTNEICAATPRSVLRSWCSVWKDPPPPPSPKPKPSTFRNLLDPNNHLLPNWSGPDIDPGPDPCFSNWLDLLLLFPPRHFHLPIVFMMMMRRCRRRGGQRRRGRSTATREDSDDEGVSEVVAGVGDQAISI